MQNNSLPFYEHKILTIEAGSFLGNWVSFPLHLHSAPEIYRVTRGRLKVQIGTQEYWVSEGNMVVIFPNRLHSFEIENSHTHFDMIICGPDPNNGFPLKMSNHILKDPVLPLSMLHPDVNYMFSRLLEEGQNRQSAQNIPLINAYFQIFWTKLLPSLTLIDTEQPVVPDLVTKLITYISEHFCEPLSLESLSKELGVCRFYLSRIFTQVLHISFCKYVNTLRVNHAQKLLLNPQYKILDVAIECGFQNQQTFNRVFKDLCGITPARYRESHTAQSQSVKFF